MRFDARATAATRLRPAVTTRRVSSFDSIDTRLTGGLQRSSDMFGRDDWTVHH